MARHSDASEAKGVEAALERLPEMERFVQRLLGRFRRFTDLPPGASVLDLGAAQGMAVIAYKRAGFAARGVEPWAPAIDVGRELAARTGVRLEILQGVGEALPYEDSSFSLVHASTVLEHVDDPHQVFREVYRVLRPGGAFFFDTTSTLSPRQNEIERFPLFPWYPPRWQRTIMDWAARERPWLVGYTTRPAIHWFSHRQLRRDLPAIGFRLLVDRWELRAMSGELSGARERIVRAAAHNRAIRLAGDVVVSGLEYLAVK